MIEFRRLRVKNFGLYADLDFPLDNQGLVCIRGLTGVGKSTLFRAIHWCLYGKTAENLKVAELAPNKKPTAVRLDFRVGKHDYVLTRFRNHPEFKNKVLLRGHGIPVVDEDSLVADVTPHLMRLLRLPETVFLTTTYFAQRNFHYFHTLTENSRKEYIESLTYGSLFAECENEARTRLRTLEQEVAAVEGEIRGLEFSRDELEAEVTKATQAAEAALANEADFLRNLQVRLHDLHTARSTLDAERPQAMQKLERWHKCQQDMQAALTMVGKMEDLGDVCDVCGSRITDEQKTARIRQYRLQVNLLEQQIDKLGLANATDDLTKINDRCDAVDAELRSVEHEMVASQARQQELKKSVDTQALDSVKNRLTLTQTNLQSLEKDAAYVKFWTSGFSLRGLRSLVLNRVVEYFSQRLNGYLLETVQRRIPELRMSMDGAKLVADFGGRGYNSLSGGERQLIDVCTGLALRDVAELHNKARTNLLVFDEPTEGLDKHLTVVAQELLRSAAKPTTFFVTHQNSEAAFDKIYEVSKCNGVSELRRVQ